MRTPIEPVRSRTHSARSTLARILSATSPGFVRISDASVRERNSGITEMVFSVTRAGGATAASVDYTLYLNGNADAADLARDWDDVLQGAAGRDTLFGGADADIFRYIRAADPTGASYEVIGDFGTGGGSHRRARGAHGRGADGYPLGVTCTVLRSGIPLRRAAV